MVRLLSLTASLGLLCGLFLFPSATAANDLIDFLKRWGDSQRGYDERHSNWDERQRERYRPTPQPVVPGIPYRQPLDVSLTSSECGLEPGNYDVDLYGGERMHLLVTPGANGGVPLIGNGVSPQTLLAEADVLKPHVDTVVLAVRAVDDRNLLDAARDAQKELERTIRALTRNDVEDAREHHDHFSADWQRFNAGLARYRVGPSVRSHLEAIERHDHRLDALFRNRASYWDYDRPRLYGLTRVLSQKAGQLKNAYPVNPRDWRSKAIARQLGRVQYSVNGFGEAIRDGADFETLIEEYRYFDDAWHRVLDRVGQLGQFSPQLIAIGRDIWDIDAALAEVLLIDPPSFSDRQVAANVLDRFASGSRRLQRELEIASTQNRDRVTSYWGLNQSCDRLDRACQRFEARLNNGSTMRECAGEFAELADAWKMVRQATDRIPRTPSRQSLAALIDTMSADYERLRRSVNGDYQWRLASARR